MRYVHDLSMCMFGGMCFPHLAEAITCLQFVMGVGSDVSGLVYASSLFIGAGCLWYCSDRLMWGWTGEWPALL